MTDVTVGGLSGGDGAGDLGFLSLAVAGVGEEVERVASAHDTGAGEREGDAGGIDGDPATSPLFGDECCGAGTTRRVEDEITGICNHDDAALYDFFRSLYYVALFRSEPRYPGVAPDIVLLDGGKILEIANVIQSFVC